MGGMTHQVLLTQIIHSLTKLIIKQLYDSHMLQKLLNENV